MGHPVLCKLLDDCIREGGADLLATLDTLGKTDLPPLVSEVANQARARLCNHYVVESRASGLQGPLIKPIAEAAGDPDDEVDKWIVDEAVPLGIEVPIKSCGAFPRAEPVTAEDECEAASHGWK